MISNDEVVLHSLWRESYYGQPYHLISEQYYYSFRVVLHSINFSLVFINVIICHCCIEEQPFKSINVTLITVKTKRSS